MRVLFVSSGNILKFGISPIVKNQGLSLSQVGVHVEYFTIKGKGFLNYIKSIRKIRKYLRNNTFQLIHAHYSFSGIIACLAMPRIPVVVSLMGSDSEASLLFKVIIKFFNKFCWDVVIVKSSNIKSNLQIENAVILPNGVNFELFREISSSLSRKKIDFQGHGKLVVFIANPKRKEKNYDLAKHAIEILQETGCDVTLYIVFGKDGIDNEKIPYYINAADTLLLTSIREGSPNVIKEAMACNCPVVSTNVGDVNEVISNTQGCYITSFDPIDISSKLRNAIYYGKTEGRKNIARLSSENVAQKLKQIYISIIK